MFNGDEIKKLKDNFEKIQQELVDLKNQVLPKYLIRFKLKNDTYVYTKEFNYEIYATSKQMAQQFLQFSGNSVQLNDGRLIMLSEVSNYEFISLKRLLNE